MRRERATSVALLLFFHSAIAMFAIPISATEWRAPGA